MATLAMTSPTTYALNETWMLWSHLPHPLETDWSINGYKEIMKFTTVEETIGLCKSIPANLVQTCMFYLTKQHVKPLWEDVHNRKGGCFSYQIANNLVADVWTRLSYALVGNTLSSNAECMATINGISVSPKKKFCIVKIWLSGCKFQDPNIITKAIPGLVPNGCLFKKHTPEY